MKFILVCFVFRDNNCHGWVKDIPTKPINKSDKGNASAHKISAFRAHLQSNGIVRTIHNYHTCPEVLPGIQLTTQRFWGFSPVNRQTYQLGMLWYLTALKKKKQKTMPDCNTLFRQKCLTFLA